MDAIDDLPVFPRYRPATRAVLILRFTILASLVFAAASGIFSMLLVWNPSIKPIAGVPGVFVITTGLMAWLSFSLHRAVERVRVEKQRPFRTWLFLAIVIGAIYMAFQAFGLAVVSAQGVPSDQVQTGSVPFAKGVISMHLLHVVGAMLALIWIAVQAVNDRYDHEFYRPVNYCALFWHFLGGVWLSLLVILSIAL